MPRTNLGRFHGQRHGESPLERRIDSQRYSAGLGPDSRTALLSPADESEPVREKAGADCRDAAEMLLVSRVRTFFGG